MNFAPFFTAPPPIQSHILAALLVLALTPVQFVGPRKGSPIHRAAGYFWLASMVVVALTSFWITQSTVKPRIGPFGPIHLLSVLALFSVFNAIRLARTQARSPSQDIDLSDNRLPDCRGVYPHA